MRIINDYHSRDPYFNLAAEEYFLTESSHDICRFWQNDNSVVIGKHQALPAEVNTKIASEKNIKTARRISGGGTVYHDSGNLNFTIISTNANGENLINFNQFTEPIKKALIALNLPVEHSERNDLLIDGLKISGNAEHLSQKLKRTLHHGTLLFNSDLNNLGAVLRTPIDQFEGKFVHSKRSKVTNILDYLEKKMDMESFRSHLETYFVDHYQGLPQPLNSNEISAIEKLAEEKYSKESWILGYSPKFKFNLSFEGEGISISTEKGKVVGLKGNHPGTNQIQDVLMGLFYSYENINSALKELSWESNRKINLLSSIFGN